MASRQAPIQSGFGHNTTATEALASRDLTGLNAIVTGGYSGLGLETVSVLTGAGAHVTVPARNLEKAEQALTAGVIWFDARSIKHKLSRTCTLE